MLADIWSASAHHANTPPEKLTIKTAPNTPLAVGDSLQLVRAFGNLLRNAEEAGASTIAIETMPAEQKGFVTTRISDDGIGIPASMQDKIWASFFSTKGEGYKGMGLAACLHVITQLNGSIRVESLPEEGTTFIIDLPAVIAPIPEADFSKTVEKISVIAPEGEWANFIEETLQKAGKTVTKDFAPEVDMLLLTETMAEKTLPTLEKLGDKTIIVSAAPSVENITKYLQAGVKDMVLKPYTPRELAALLQ